MSDAEVPYKEIRTSPNTEVLALLKESSLAEMTHPETAVHSRDEHDGHQDNEAGDEEAHH